MTALGNIDEIEAKPLPSRYPGGTVCKVIFSSGAVRGLGFIVAQGTGKSGAIKVMHFFESGFNEDEIREKLISHYRDTKSK